jgi:hypothetical protein
MGLLDDMAEGFGEIVGTGAGLAVAPIAIMLGVSQTAVRSAIAAGCTTVEEIKEFLDV